MQMTTTKRQRFPDEERKKLVKLGVKCLWADEGREALNYLLNERGFKEDTLKNFNVGFCPIRVDHELSGRIITPIYDPYGTLIALSTRHINDKRNFWHESFEKSFSLYGLYQAKQSIIKHKKAIIVEGEYDVLYLHSYGFTMTVGVCGSAFTPFHLSLLARYSDELYLVFDNDPDKFVNGKWESGTGKKATKRAMDVSSRIISGLDVGLKVIPVNLSPATDPDEFVKQFGTGAFLDRLKESKDKFIL